MHAHTEFLNFSSTDAGSWTWSFESVSYCRTLPNHFKEPNCKQTTVDPWIIQIRTVDVKYLDFFNSKYSSTPWILANSKSSRRTEEPSMLQPTGWQRAGRDLATEHWQHAICSLVQSCIPNHGYRGTAISEKGYKLNWTAQSTRTPKPHDIQGLVDYKSSTSYLVDSTFKKLDIQSLATLHQLQCHDSVLVTYLLPRVWRLCLTLAL